MRISTQAFQTRTLEMIQQKTAEIAKTQAQIASGERLTRAGDDPAAAARGVALDSALEQIARFQSSIGQVRERLIGEEAALDELTGVLNTVRELTIQGGGAAMDASTAQSLAEQLRAQIDAVYGIANRQDADGNALFAGTRQTGQAFAASGSGASYLGDAQTRSIRIGPNQSLADGHTGGEVFMAVPAAMAVTAAAGNTGTASLGQLAVDTAASPAGLPWSVRFEAGNWTVADEGGSTLGSGVYTPGESFTVDGVTLGFDDQPADGDSFAVLPGGQQDVFATLDQIAGALAAFDGSSASRAQLTTALYRGLDNVESATKHVIDLRASVGNGLQTLDRAEDSHEGVAVELMGTLSDLRGVDIAEAASRLSLQITALEAAQQTLVRMQGLSLFRLL